MERNGVIDLPPREAECGADLLVTQEECADVRSPFEDDDVTPAQQLMAPWRAQQFSSRCDTRR